ncbi:MAG TPA: hypothetical protein VFG50_07260 [Rhodothermales bacterium]|nr:hypothetical protein [Rhodothermales bacterium]
MKLTRIAVLTLCSAFLLAAPAQAQSAAPSVDAILSRYYSAVGGLDKLKQIQSTKTNAMVTGQGMDMPAVFYQKRPNKLRTEVTVQGMTMVQAYDGTNAWAIVPFTGSSEPQDIMGDQADVMKEQAYMDGLLVDYQEKGYTIELAGTEQVDGVDAYKLKVTSANGTDTYYYMDAQRYLPVQVEKTISQNGMSAHAVTTLADYRPEGGVLMPHLIKQTVDGHPVAQIALTQIEINPQIPDSIFTRPAR